MAIDPFFQDFFGRRAFLDSGPILFVPKFILPVMSGAELLAESLDIWYDVVEHPTAVDRMVDDGCPNH